MRTPGRSRLSFGFAVLVLLAVILPSAAAQDGSSFMVRILQITMGRYTCTAMTADHQLEQLMVVTNHGSPPPSELRRRPATDEDVKVVNELLQQPQFRAAASETPRIPQVLIRRDGKFVMVLARVDGKPKIVQFSDLEGKKTMPAYFKGFEALAEEVRRRKLPKPGGKVTPNCRVTME